MVTSLVNQSKLGAGLADEIENSFDLAQAQPTLQETGSYLTTSAAEQTLYIRDYPASVFDPRVVMISLDDLVALDNLVLRVYYRLSDGGSYYLFDYANYIGADGGLTDGRKMIAITLLPCRHGVKVTAQQSVGTATLEWSVVEEA